MAYTFPEHDRGLTARKFYLLLVFTIHAIPTEVADDTYMSQNGSQYMQYHLVETTNSVKRHMPEYKDYYAIKYQETL